jgi:choline transport protein
MATQIPTSSDSKLPSNTKSGFEGADPDVPLEMLTTTGTGEQYAITELDDERFSLWSVLGVQYTTSATPLSICGFMQFTLAVGGSPFFFWCFLVVVVLQGLLVLSFAELGSSFPHVAGMSFHVPLSTSTDHRISGQTYWTSVLAPPKYKRFLTYFNGIMTIWAWIFGLTGGYLLSSQFVVAGATIVSPSYTPQHWHLYLLAVCMALVSVVLNTVLIKIFPLLNRFFLFWINGGVIYMLVVLLAKAQPKASGTSIFVDVVNLTGWSSNGLVFLMGLFPGQAALALPDSVTHMSEELPNPQRRIPQVMLGAFLLSSIGGLVTIVVVLFCIVNHENLLEPLGGQPILQICWDAWNNKGWVITVDIIFIATFAQASNAIVTGTSRIIWSFAKSGGLPFVAWVTRVNPKLQLPVNAVLLCAGIGITFDILQFAPSYVLNAIYGSAVICLMFSYGIPIFLLMIAGRQNLPSRRYFNLGRFGYFINFMSLVWLLLAAIVFCIPLSYPVTKDGMNWAPVVAVTAIALSLINWFLVRKTYQLPIALAFARTHHHEDETS